jgi:hypothetical protein
VQSNIAAMDVQMIELPAFTESHAAALMICATLRTKDRKITQRVKALHKMSSAMIARMKGRNDPATVALFGGGPGQMANTHLHVNILRRRNLGPLPKSNSKSSEVQAAMQPFIGQRADVSLSAYFRVPIGDLPAEGGIIRPALALDAQLGDVTIKQTGAYLRIVGGPIDSVRWRMPTDGQEIRVELEVDRQVIIGDSYLTDCYNLARSAFRLLVLGEVSNGS